MTFSGWILSPGLTEFPTRPANSQDPQQKTTERTHPATGWPCWPCWPSSGPNMAKPCIAHRNGCNLKWFELWTCPSCKRNEKTRKNEKEREEREEREEPTLNTWNKNEKKHGTFEEQRNIGKQQVLKEFKKQRVQTGFFKRPFFGGKLLFFSCQTWRPAPKPSQASWAGARRGPARPWRRSRPSASARAVAVDPVGTWLVPGGRWGVLLASQHLVPWKKERKKEKKERKKRKKERGALGLLCLHVSRKHVYIIAHKHIHIALIIDAHSVSQHECD